jgi:hypothetical protein
MKLATAPVNWNNADAPDFREWFPYPKILDLMGRRRVFSDRMGDEHA